MSSTGDKITSHAKSAIGKKHKLGAKGPDEFDCSGLAIWCHQMTLLIMFLMSEFILEIIKWFMLLEVKMELKKLQLLLIIGKQSLKEQEEIGN